MLMKPSVCGFLFFIVATMSFVACGGGGGGSTGGGSGVVPTSTPTFAQATPTPIATPTTAPASLTVNGSVQEFTAGTALAGFTVTVGSVPNATTCLNTESATAMPCGVPASPLPTVATSATGTFSITVPAAGTYMLTIGKDATYATLHRTITVTAGSSLALGTLKVAALSSDEQNWLIDVNHQRSTVSVPVSFANLVVDEYAEEQARAEVAAIVSGSQAYGDATESLFAGNYVAAPGALFQASGAATLIAQSGQYVNADREWMTEIANCPGGNWETCAFAETTGHYINVSNTQNVWIGLGESSSSFNYMSLGLPEWAYDLIPVVNYQMTYPTAGNRKFVSGL